MLRKFYALIAAFTLLTTVSTAQVVNIPDPDLRLAIRQTLGLQQGVAITQDDMLQLTELHYHESNLSNLSGIEHAANLKYLYLTKNQISDISPVSGLTKLRTLMIHVNPIQDISPVANLTELTYLGFIGCRVSDISAMSKLVNLEKCNYPQKLDSRLRWISG